MLSNKTRKILLFHRKTVYKGSKNVPKPLLYSHIKYIYLSYPFEWQKTDFNQFFIPYHHPQFAQNIFTFFFYIGKIQPLFLKMKGIFSSPKQSICIFPENIWVRAVLLLKSREKLQYHDIPPFVLFDNSNAQHKKKSCFNDFLSTNYMQNCQSVSYNHNL